ncbi:MAG: hypothetical protein EXX96DRAFT_258770 [Benjaminiella poitrasii]|nr:MAG: hypothetical protein EXX96DRAFT_258770 [Benjaminiella poitrasii]
MRENTSKVKWKILFKTSFNNWILKKEKRANGTETSYELANSTPSQLQDNFRKFKRDAHRYNLDKWIKSEKAIKSSSHISNDIQRRQIPYIRSSTIQAFKPRVAIEVFKQLQYVLHDTLSPNRG